jgi:hypothetical protein
VTEEFVPQDCVGCGVYFLLDWHLVSSAVLGEIGKVQF